MSKCDTRPDLECQKVKSEKRKTKREKRIQTTNSEKPKVKNE